jgi:hypothetical protein
LGHSLHNDKKYYCKGQKQTNKKYELYQNQKPQNLIQVWKHKLTFENNATASSVVGGSEYERIRKVWPEKNLKKVRINI